MKKVPATGVVTDLEASESPLPARIQEALGELVGAAREGLLALSVGVGLGVVHELMELEVYEVVGPRGRHNHDRAAVRHGHENGSMTLGGRRVAVRRPRMRTADAERELPVESCEYFADRDPLTRAVMDRMLAGVSTRKFEQVGEPVGASVEQECSSTGKTSVSEMFIERTRTALGELMGRRLEDVRLAVMMLDGLEIAERTHVVALGITTEGAKIPLGLWEGSTENATLARTLLADLVDRGLDPEQAILFVIDGAKALQRAIKDVIGEHALVSGLLLSSPRSPRPALALQPARGSLRLRLRSARPVPGAGALVRAIHTTKEAPVAPSNINRVVLTGNLAADPDLRSLPSGASVCRLRLAVNTRRKDSASGEYVDKPNYFDVVVWGAQGKACARCLAKGSPAAIDGHLEWREWQVDGRGKRQAVEVIADAVQFLGGNRREERDAQRPEPTAASEAA